jgi:hypothetical protein
MKKLRMQFIANIIKIPHTFFGCRYFSPFVVTYYSTSANRFIGGVQKDTGISLLRP